MKAVWIDDDNDYRIDDEFDVHPSSVIFTGDDDDCKEFIEQQNL